MGKTAEDVDTDMNIDLTRSKSALFPYPFFNMFKKELWSNFFDSSLSQILLVKFDPRICLILYFLNLRLLKYAHFTII